MICVFGCLFVTLLWWPKCGCTTKDKMTKANIHLNSWVTCHCLRSLAPGRKQLATQPNQPIFRQPSLTPQASQRLKGVWESKGFVYQAVGSQRPKVINWGWSVSMYVVWCNCMTCMTVWRLTACNVLYCLNTECRQSHCWKQASSQAVNCSTASAGAWSFHQCESGHLYLCAVELGPLLWEHQTSSSWMRLGRWDAMMKAFTISTSTKHYSIVCQSWIIQYDSFVQTRCVSRLYCNFEIVIVM